MTRFGFAGQGAVEREAGSDFGMDRPSFLHKAAAYHG